MRIRPADDVVQETTLLITGRRAERVPPFGKGALQRVTFNRQAAPAGDTAGLLEHNAGLPPGTRTASKTQGIPEGLECGFARRGGAFCLLFNLS